MDRLGRYFLDRPSWLVALVAMALIALPVAVYLDLRALSDETLRRQAASLNGIVSSTPKSQSLSWSTPPAISATVKSHWPRR